MKKNIIMISMTFIFCAGAFAAESAPKESSTAPSKELREQMAKAHEKMALCLRSETSVHDCHDQMRAQCQDMKNGDGCFMMGKMGRGMMGKHKKSDSTKDK